MKCFRVSALKKYVRAKNGILKEVDHQNIVKFVTGKYCEVFDLKTVCHMRAYGWGLLMVVGIHNQKDEKPKNIIL